MDLYILRHAIALIREADGGGSDEERPLTDRGAAKLRRVLRGMKALGLSFDRILTSPYLRALQTAEIVAAEMGAPRKVEQTLHLAPAGDPRALMALLRSRRGDQGSVLVVGHEPYLSELISVLISGATGVAVTMKKAGLCKLTLDTPRYGRCARLEWLLAPAHLQRMH
jgi:phosphohistidine phosphatase